MQSTQSLPSYGNVQLQLSNHIATMTMNRPQSGNSLHPKMLAEMVSAMKWMDKHRDIRIILITGAGRFFNTGMELLDDSGVSFAKGSDFHELNRLFILSEKILIGAVNGPAAGYGVSCLALFDLVYSVPDAYFFTPFVKWGMAAEGASSFSFPRLMGHQRAASLFLAGDRISAVEAEKLGIVSKILPKDGFLRRVIDTATKMAKAPPGSLLATKKLMKAPVLQDLLDANNRECTLIHEERFGFEEYNEAIKQFRIEQDQKRAQKSKI
ncbi:ClpP/crotonase-like domain-containing protein [Halenospora varia]|nr:ClpP/crotonase-like domain-containing protein [Halenospora varia]